MSTFSEIEVLPRELIYLIFDRIPKSLCKLRLVTFYSLFTKYHVFSIDLLVIVSYKNENIQASQSMKTCVDDYSLTQPAIQLVDELIFDNLKIQRGVLRNFKIEYYYLNFKGDSENHYDNFQEHSKRIQTPPNSKSFLDRSNRDGWFQIYFPLQNKRRHSYASSLLTVYGKAYSKSHTVRSQWPGIAGCRFCDAIWEAC